MQSSHNGSALRLMLPGNCVLEYLATGGHMARVLALCASVIVSLIASPAHEKPKAAGNEGRHRAPKIWTEEGLQNWYNPLAGRNVRPNHYSEAEYYTAPIDNLRSYP